MQLVLLVLIASDQCSGSTVAGVRIVELVKRGSDSELEELCESGSKNNSGCQHIIYMNPRIANIPNMSSGAKNHESCIGKPRFMNVAMGTPISIILEIP